MMRDLFVREGFDFDFQYDWIVKKQQLKSRGSLGSRNTLVVEEDKRGERNGGDTTNRGTQLHGPSTSQNFYAGHVQQHFND